MEKPFHRMKTLPSHSPAQAFERVASHSCGGMAVFFVVSLLSLALPLDAREQRKKADYGSGFSAEISSPEDVVEQALQAVVNDGTIQGSTEYNKDKFIEKAVPATSSPFFAEYNGPGKVFFKVRESVLAPVNFKESNDQGTLAVRYILETKSAQATIVRIDAVFVEDFRRVVHASNGSVENAEFKEVEDRVEALELDKKQAIESERHRQEELARKALEKKQAEQASAAAQTGALANTPEQQVEMLRRQLERIVRAPGAQLKSAPFHSASNLKTLNAGSEVVILIATPYWYGVETEGGEHGWVNHTQLELIP